MPIKIGNKVYRNLQEQVAKNKEDIENISKSLPYPSNEYYNKDEIDALIPKQHQVTFKINNYYQTANYMYPSSEALTDEEFKNFLKKIKILKVTGSQSFGEGNTVMWEVPSEDTISFRTIIILDDTISDDIQDFAADEITFTDRVIEY